MKADITLAIQSPGFWNRANSSDPVTRAAARANWATNSHFMVADTAVGGNTALQYGVGFVNADLLWSDPPTAHREAETAKAHRG